VSGFPPGVRKVTDAFAVAPQLTEADVARAAAAGARLIVNNRPDDEEAGQPSAREMAEAAAEAGVAYVHIPVRGMPSPAQAQEMAAAIEAVDGPAIAFCRSGMRSVFTWALGQQMSGVLTRDEAVAAAARAGYDLSPYLRD
jgi:uncharacterized protein (TIGR01244 family)